MQNNDYGSWLSIWVLAMLVGTVLAVLPLDRGGVVTSSGRGVVLPAPTITPRLLPHPTAPLARGNPAQSEPHP
jgi:hypothetical protein